MKLVFQDSFFENITPDASPEILIKEYADLVELPEKDTILRLTITHTARMVSVNQSTVFVLSRLPIPLMDRNIFL